MKKRIIGAEIFILFVLIFSSCRREEVNIDQFLVHPYVKKDSTMGLSVFVISNIDDEDSLKMQITDPTGSLVWYFEPERIIKSGVTYMGSSRVAMPTGALLPQGEWKFLLMYKDGRSIDRKFTVFYKDVSGLLERSSSSNSVFFSTMSNLTFLPR